MPGSDGTFVLVAGSCDAAVVTKDASGTVHESKVEDAIKHAVTGAEKQTAQEVDVDPEDIGKAWQETVKEM
jgi:hypothetical protein